ncbi:MAG TPA: hypothetical protein IAA22_08500 [Candidatus Olsenella stercoravium]|uniref:PASTA domain-containing protein n=1 Tax=Candidatus Olsenella stercoravium TaxID=2838713 RepID=A0A9D2DLD7_9ACTN|nr:hypothetical protein [Candidatus Olsenella stercoravium]
MRFTKTVVAALALSTALLVGCGGQAPATDATDATGDEAAVEQTEPEAEPAMSNWQEGSFYERPLPEIASDLELLGFELTDEFYDDSDPSGTYTFFMPTFQGTPGDNPVEGSDETVTIGLTYENPTFAEGTDERTCETLDQEVLPTGATIGFYLPEADSSEYEAIARSVGDAVGLPAFTDSTVGDPFETGRVIGNFTYPDTFKGQEIESMLIISVATSPESLPNPDMPLFVSYGPYLSDLT